MRLNLENFNKLTEGLTRTQISKKLGISRCQLWRIKNGDNVGTKVISNFKKAFPEENSDNYFF